MTEEKIIQACLRQDRTAQKELYTRYAPIFLGIIRRYVKDDVFCEDILIDAFYKIFSQIDKYSGLGSFEGWMKRIVINEALMYVRKLKNNRRFEPLDQVKHQKIDLIESQMDAQTILNLLDELPPGYRTVFNLYVVEGYKHREIAELLGISVNTSKSQLILAKKRMRALVTTKLYPDLKSNNNE